MQGSIQKRHREQAYGHGGEEGEGEMMERVTWKLRMPSVNRLAVGILCMTQELTQGFCDRLAAWGGEGGGREFREGGKMGVPIADSC